MLIKNFMIKRVGRNEDGENSTGLSNLGLIRLPEQIKDKVDCLPFALCPHPNIPYQFANVSTEDVLIFTSTVATFDTTLVERICSKLDFSN